MLVATHDDKQNETVTEWLQRLIPICPKCGKAMYRSGKGRTEPLLTYYKCRPCGITHKTKDRIV